MPPIPEDRTIINSSGLTVGYYEYGDPNGRPVMVFHGTPACGAGFAWADDPARDRRLRLIAPDRPGVGRSDRRDGWRVGDYPAMVAAFADALKIDRFAVWGYSGGGPYAVACLSKLTSRIDGAAIAAGMGEMGVHAEASDFEKTDRQLLSLAVKHPRIARTMLSVSAWLARRAPKGAMKSFDTQLSDTDRQVLPSLGTPEEAMALFTKAFTNGPHGVVADYVAISQPWQCDLSAVTLPSTIWHGTADTMVPFRHAEQLAARLPKSTLKVWDGEGHLAPIAHVGEILDALV